jgi:hypothetical protein
MDPGEASLLVTLWAAGDEARQIEVLTQGTYTFAQLSNTVTSIIVAGPEAQASLSKATAVAAGIRDVEAVWGPWPFRGAVIDTQALDANCHGGSRTSSGVHVARLWMATTSSPAATSCSRPGTIAHEITHAYFGANFPTWFTEGIAELGALYVTGARSGYISAASLTTRIVDLRLPTTDARYTPQGSAGADFLVRVNRIIGRDAMVAAVLPLRGQLTTTPAILDALRQNTPPGARDQVEALIAWFFEGVGPAPR